MYVIQVIALASESRKQLKLVWKLTISAGIGETQVKVYHPSVQTCTHTICSWLLLLAGADKQWNFFARLDTFCICPCSAIAAKLLV